MHSSCVPVREAQPHPVPFARWDRHRNYALVVVVVVVVVRVVACSKLFCFLLCSALFLIGMPTQQGHLSLDSDLYTRCCAYV